MIPERVLVLGLARSGQAAAAALERRGVEVVRVDRRPLPGALSEEAASLDGVGLLVKSPGVPGERPLVVAARERGIPVWSEVELAYRLLGDRPILGVTGTNGKTTTSELLGAMLGAPVAGNVGRPLSGLVDEPGEGWIVCELSSFQLEDVERFRPRVAVLLNLEPDHLDRHGSFEGYRAAKLRIFENQTADDTAVVPRDFDRVPGDGRAQHRAEELARRRLPVRPGDAEDRPFAEQAVGELDLAPDGDPAAASLGHERRLAGHPRALDEEADAVERRDLLGNRPGQRPPVDPNHLHAAPLERRRRGLTRTREPEDERPLGDHRRKKMKSR